MTVTLTAKYRPGESHQQRIYYFARVPGPNAIEEMPAGYEVVEHHNGVLLLKKTTRTSG
jgi:hypothetical protein